MAEQELNDASKRERSPSFPFIGLSKAVERTRQLYEKAKKFEVLLIDAAQAWEMQPKSSTTLQTAAALLAFGLIEDSGSGPSRKVKVSEAGMRILGDTRPGVQDTLLSEAALKPKLIAEYALKWGGGRPDDNFCISELKYDKGFNDEGAARFLKVFDETHRFVKSSTSDRRTDRGTGEKPVKVPSVGDYIQWTSGGVDQLPAPCQVTAVSDDGQWLWIEESPTGIPAAEATIVSAPVGYVPPSPLQVGGRSAKPRADVREEKFALKEGDVVISYPEGLSPDSVDDLDSYLQVFLKKVRREAGSRN